MKSIEFVAPERASFPPRALPPGDPVQRGLFLGATVPRIPSVGHCLRRAGRGATLPANTRPAHSGSCPVWLVRGAQRQERDVQRSPVRRALGNGRSAAVAAGHPAARARGRSTGAAPPPRGTPHLRRSAAARVRGSSAGPASPPVSAPARSPGQRHHGRALVPGPG